MGIIRDRIDREIKEEVEVRSDPVTRGLLGQIDNLKRENVGLQRLLETYKAEYKLRILDHAVKFGSGWRKAFDEMVEAVEGKP